MKLYLFLFLLLMLLELTLKLILKNLSFINKKFDGKISEGHVDETIKEATAKSYKLIGRNKNEWT